MPAHPAARQISRCVTCPVRHVHLCREIAPRIDENEKRSGPFAFRGFRPRDLISQQGIASDNILIICQGTAVRFNRLADGRRKIHSIILSGESISVTSIYSNVLPFSVESLSDCQVALFRRREIQMHLATNDKFLGAFAAACSVALNNAREHGINLALRSSKERICHLILWYHSQLQLRSVQRVNRFAFPLRQQDIADFAGLSIAHVNRVLAELRKEKILDISLGILEIQNLEALRALGTLE